MDITRFFNDNINCDDKIEYCATSKFKDEDGNAIPWVLRKISIKEYEALRAECNKNGSFNGGLFNRKFICCSVVEPNLNNAQLQDSYGVRKPEDLITELFDNAGEYFRLLNYLLDINGFKNVEGYVEESKN